MWGTPSGTGVAHDRWMNPLSSHVAHYGLPFVAANVFLEQLGVPIPAEPTLVIAGGLAGSGLLSPLGLLAATIAAAIMADSSLFLLGRRWQSAVWRIVGRLSRSGEGSEERAKPVFARWGLRALVLARFLPGVSQVMVLMAGATGARFRSFLGYDLMGAVLWVTLPIGGGMLFSAQLDRFLTAASRIGSSILLAVAAVVVVVLASRRALRKSGSLAPSLRHRLEEPPPLVSAAVAVLPGTAGSSVVKIPAVGAGRSSSRCSVVRQFEAFEAGTARATVAPRLHFRADVTGVTVHSGEGPA
jgi:membrane protein DedA with SNARE-associated domain